MSNRAKIIIGDSRNMEELEDGSINLIVTSPPYWHIKNYGHKNQIGYGQSLHEYLKDLYRVWKECYRVLENGRRLVINIGDQFARAIIYGKYKIIPLHSEIIAQCEDIGFDFMGSIIWQKKTTMNTTGGANVMGSYPYPPNGMVEIDYEYILIFKKPGNYKKVDKTIKEKSKLSKEEWKEYFSGHWQFPGVRQNGHEAMFPEELPKRIIKMFSFVNDTVLDPFLGSGTAAKVAVETGRNFIGYEINKEFLPLIKEKLSGLNFNIQFREKEYIDPIPISYTPRIKDAEPVIEPEKLQFKKNTLYKVKQILENGDIVLNTGIKVRLKGVKIIDLENTLKYLNKYVLNKEIFLKFDKNYQIKNEHVEAYVYLKNKIFINSYLIKSGLAETDTSIDFDLKNRFLKLQKDFKGAV